jgi:G:T/U-mismatch repair DNA glycosylase
MIEKLALTTTILYIYTMGKGLLLKLFVIINFCGFAQTANFQDVKSLVQTYVSDVNLDNKLIALQVWSVNSKESREQNKAFDKAYKTFEWARLKGGNKGILCVTLCLDQSSTATIAFTKDGITTLKTISIQDISNTASFQNLTSTYNIVFDNKGQKVYESIPSTKIFSSIQQLITR